MSPETHSIANRQTSVAMQSVSSSLSPSSIPGPAEFFNYSEPFYIVGPNDSGISRGDREDTADNEAAPDELGYGPAQPTVDPTALVGYSSINQPPDTAGDIDREREDTERME